MLSPCVLVPGKLTVDRDLLVAPVPIAVELDDEVGMA